MPNETISIAVEGELVPLLNKRAKDLDLNRSQYLRRLVREDLAAAAPAEKTPRPRRRTTKKGAAA